ncbi:MAG: thioredoxin family protein [Flavobacterium sp.]
MARTPSNMQALGTEAPGFILLNTIDSQWYSFQELKGDKGTLVVFICNHCPFVHHVIDKLVAIADEFQPQGIATIAISSNDVANYPDDSPELMTEFAQKHRFDFPYLYDETQEAAMAYDAACTPDIYLFDGEDQLVYRGQMDDSRPGNGIPVTGTDLKNAITALLEGLDINPNQKPSMGCNIKWKS